MMTAILETDRWARQAKRVHKLSPGELAAYTIVFEELLGLTHADAIRAMKNVKDVDGLKAYVQKIKSEKRAATTTPKAP